MTIFWLFSIKSQTQGNILFLITETHITGSLSSVDYSMSPQTETKCGRDFKNEDRFQQQGNKSENASSSSHPYSPSQEFLLVEVGESGELGLVYLLDEVSVTWRQSHLFVSKFRIKVIRRFLVFLKRI